MDKTKISGINKVLVAALKLEEQGEVPCSLEMLSIAAWMEFPETFGIKDFEQFHPDTHKMVLYLESQNGVLNSKMMIRRDKGFILLPAGRERACEICEMCGIQLAEKQKSVPIPNAATPEQEAFLKRCLESDAFRMVVSGKALDLQYQEMAKFWGAKGPQDLDLSRMAFHVALEDVRNALLPFRELILSDGRSVVAADVSKLEEVDTILVNRFTNLLKIYRQRYGGKQNDPR